VNLSAHFTLEEMTHSETASRKGLDNKPNEDVIANLTELALALERVRAVLQCPIIISSGYRSPKVNIACGGSTNPPSAHTQGYAADFIAPRFGTPQEVAKAIIAAGISFDQLIWEFGAWVHFSISPQNRGEVLTTASVNGKTSYTRGLG